MTEKKQLVTKCDIDGLLSGIFLKEMNLIEQISFCSPRDIEKGVVEISSDKITAGLPYQKNVHLAFDSYTGSHGTEKIEENRIVDASMPSTSRVIFNHYGRKNFKAVPGELINAVDKGISADVTVDEILYPRGWTLLTYLIDWRTGLDRSADFSISTTRLIEKLTDWCRKYTVWEVLDLPDVEERLEHYFSCTESYKSQILHCSTVYNNLVVVDLRDEAVIYPGNRFMIYALFPECNISLQITSQSNGEKTVFAAGKSFIDKSLAIDVGKIMKTCGGGGHANAGTCETDNEFATDVFNVLVKSLRYGFLKNLVMGYYS